ncbi:brain and acute leukemia cytoplasmic protein [Parus major]|uniref:brain and acute leukemia cytoplasmic protein n=1 Tax=Parus major TaxID=9157 RepID=UPI000771611A|nr:brain and acute leukemia cytoplasmic protein [Parus major]
MWQNRGMPEPATNCSSVLIVQFHVSLPGLLEDGKLAHTGVSTASATAGMLSTEKRNNCGSQCANTIVHSMGTTTQRQNGFRTTESKWDTQKMSTQELAINVTKGIRQSDRRKTKNCAN